MTTVRKIDCQEARLEAERAVSQEALAHSCPGKASSSDKGGDGDGEK